MRLISWLIIVSVLFSCYLRTQQPLFIVLAALAFVTPLFMNRYTPQAKPQSTALTVMGQQAQAYRVVENEPAQMAAHDPKLIDVSDVTGQQMYYEMERKAINAALAPFGFLSYGKILIRSRAVVYPLIYSRERKDGRKVKIKVEQIEEHLMSLTVDVSTLRAQYGYGSAKLIAIYEPFALVVNAINEQPLPWSMVPTLEPTQAALGLDCASIDEAPVVWDIDDTEDEYFALLLGGIPKAGKTTLMRSIILQLCNKLGPDKLQLHIVENPKGDFETLRNLPHVVDYVPWTGAIDLLTKIVDVHCQGKPSAERPYHLVLVDEIQRYAKEAAYRDEFLRLSTQILNIGRALRIRLIYATPRPSANMLGNDIIELFQMRVAGKLGAAGSRIIIQSDSADRLTAKGAFILRRDGVDTLFYGFYLENLDHEIESIAQKHGHLMALPKTPEAATIAQVIPERFNGEALRGDVWAFVQANMGSDKLKHGAQAEALQRFYGVSNYRSAAAQPAKDNLRAHIEYYKVSNQDQEVEQ